MLLGHGECGGVGGRGLLEMQLCNSGLNLRGFEIHGHHILKRLLTLRQVFDLCSVNLSLATHQQLDAAARRPDRPKLLGSVL